ncbi:hypothetical protein CTEN210_04264 [Chaetoceros tenuissimus]|uniref:Potassium channel tetramerisation-type BTB domain-containing protein n=1 Tax=Chaetoceros tenuissimus TaxID=426638 RepID=A0AAD3CNA3_9STRA|nr:hypothetical protein CTEN210_04264 [Chaetoceros tenuissimus]
MCNGDFFDPGSSRVDDFGRSVYFIDRSSDLFEYILKYLTENEQSWPSFVENKTLWRRLKKEAEFYGLFELVETLKTTYRCPYNENLSILARGKGILYWLGLGHSDAYTNPADLGLVEMHQDADPMNHEYASFFQYRPLRNKCEASFGRYYYNLETRGGLQMSNYNESHYLQNASNTAVITFYTMRIKPTHISLRYGSSFGTNTFDFEASRDKKTWINLCRVRPNVQNGRLSTLCPSEGTIGKYLNEYNDKFKRNRCENDPANEREYWTNILEEKHREVWKVDEKNNDFYRYFRIRGIGKEEFQALRSEIEKLAVQAANEENEKIQSEDIVSEDNYNRLQSTPMVTWETSQFWEDHCPRCLINGVGFEIYGDVCEL